RGRAHDHRGSRPGRGRQDDAGKGRGASVGAWESRPGLPGRLQADRRGSRNMSGTERQLHAATGSIADLQAEAERVTAAIEAERLDAQIARRDLEPYRRGNTGIPYAFSFDSGRPGPHVVVTSLAHGNEPGGLEAVVALVERGIAPLRGRLSLAICNVEAYHASNGVDPYGARFVEEDFNRVWSDEKLDGD